MNVEVRRTLGGGTSVLGLILLSLVMPMSARAQIDLGSDFGFPSLTLGELGDDLDQEATFSASYTAEGDTAGTLVVTARMGSDWHIYSMTQPAGGPTPTRIRLTGPAGVALDGAFVADEPPKIASSSAWPGLKIEEHYGEIRWRAPIRRPAGFTGEIEISVVALACMTDGSCVPQNQKLTAALASDASAVADTAADSAVAATTPAESTAAAAGADVTLVTGGDPADGEPTFRNAKSVVQWTGRLIPAKARPGDSAILQITAKPDKGFHVYAAAIDDSESRTNFVITDKAGLRMGMPVPPSPPIVKEFLPGLPPIHYHEGEITWSIPIEISDATAEGTKTIRGLLGYQACTDTSCLQPKALKFAVPIEVVKDPGEGTTAQVVRFLTAPFGPTMDTAAETKWVDEGVELPGQAQPAAGAGAATTGVRSDPIAASDGVSDGVSEGRVVADLSLLVILLMAVAGGLILNLMPCVLPVVGLKIMSFVSQAGEDRRKVLALNVAYTLGILVVFWALAALAIVSTYSWGREWLGVEGQMSWGQQFQYFGFRFSVILVVFALALSFLGVWEIPLPGFVGGKSTQELQKKEGFSGAFFKGIFTTVLATPCSGPLLGAVFGFTLGKSAFVIFAIFSAIGLGMALPYLLIALFPPLIAFLPKPGEWMDVLKQLLGFLLLGTVVYLFTFFPDADRVPVFMSLIGVWFGCWLVGLVPNWQTLSKRLTAWASGIAAAASIAYLAFWLSATGPVVVAWEPYDVVRLNQLRSEGRTVLIDFTAKWCPTCQINYRVALNTEATGDMVRELGAVAMLADWTDQGDDIHAKLQELGSSSIPLLAIYPGNDPDNPIVLRDLVSQGDVLMALRQAGPSVMFDSPDGRETVAGLAAETSR